MAVALQAPDVECDTLAVAKETCASGSGWAFSE